MEQFARDLQRMPPGNQDAISEENYWQLVAYILSNNGVVPATDDETIDLGLQADLYLPQLIENLPVENFVIAEGAAQILNNYTTRYPRHVIESTRRRLAIMARKL